MQDKWLPDDLTNDADEAEKAAEEYRKSVSAALKQFSSTAEGQVVIKWIRSLALARSYAPDMNPTFQETAHAEGVRELALEILDLSGQKI